MASAAITIAAAVLWLPALTVSLMEGCKRMRNIAKKRSMSGLNPGGRCCWEFPHENAGLEALHFHEEMKQVEVRLLLTLSKLSKQNFFQLIEGLIRIIADIQCVENVLEDLLRQAG
jgi:hypothetical protein